MEWFGRQGGTVFVPVTHSPDVDLIVVQHGELKRVQVKTSGAFRKGRYDVSICTRGGNQSWNGMTRMFSHARCDLVFVLVADGRRWCIPSNQIEGGTRLTLGGPKYADYEIDPGYPFEAMSAA